MRIKFLALSLMLVVLASSSAGGVSAKQSRVIKLVANDDGSTFATIHVNDENLLYEFNRPNRNDFH